MVNRVSFMSSHRWRGTFVGEARTSDVIASRRLASDWLGDDIMCKCGGGYEGASAPTTRTRRRCSTILPSVSPDCPPLPQVPPSDSATFDPPRASSLSLSAGRSPSRSIARSATRFHPCLAFVDFPTPSLTSPPSSLLPTLVGNASVSVLRAARTHTQSLLRSRFTSPHHASRRLLRGSVSAASSPVAPVPRSVPDAFASSLPFDHNSRLTNIVNTPALSGETPVPGTSRKLPLWN